MDDQTSGALRGASTGALAGASFGPIGAAVGGVAGGLIGYFGTPKRPKYDINPENEQNKALAQQEAFGQSRAITQGNDMADQIAAQDINTTQQYSSNAGTILNTLKAINNNRNQTKQGLAIADANIRSIGRGKLMGANAASIDEKDKAWNYNVNQPYQNQIAQNREMMRGNAENFWKLLDYSRAGKLLSLNRSPSMTESLPSYAYSDVADNAGSESGFNSDYIGQIEA